PAAHVNCDAEKDALFCADFDELRVEYGWDQLDTTSGTGTQDDGGATTPPFSYLAATTAGSASTVRSVMLKRTFAVEPKHVHAAVDYRVDALDMVTGGEVMYFRLRLGAVTPGDYYTVTLSHETSGLIVSQQNYRGGTGDDVGPHFTASRTPP